MLVLSSIFIALTSVSSTAIISVVVDLFPTTLRQLNKIISPLILDFSRTMAVSLTMMFGRSGAMIGNLIFPLLLDLNCTVPFFLLAAVIFCKSEQKKI